jgi:hypothetical protein
LCILNLCHSFVRFFYLTHRSQSLRCFFLTSVINILQEVMLKYINYSSVFQNIKQCDSKIHKYLLESILSYAESIKHFIHTNKSVRTVLCDLSHHICILTEAKQSNPVIYNSDKWSKLSGLNYIFIEEVWESHWLHLWWKLGNWRLGRNNEFKLNVVKWVLNKAVWI